MGDRLTIGVTEPIFCGCCQEGPQDSISRDFRDDVLWKLGKETLIGGSFKRSQGGDPL